MMNSTNNLLIFALLCFSLSGCTQSQAAAQNTYTPTTYQPAGSHFSQAQLDAMLAPIALYPDTVLSHLLIASTYPLEVVEADRWAQRNPSLKGNDALAAADAKDWDPSVKALVAFPDILARMSEDLDWTQQLGDAFLADEARVMDSVQTLRNRAYAAGNLDKVQHVRVIREQETIFIEPSVERVVYVPAYDTRVIYGNWWWPDYPPTYWTYPSRYTYTSGFYWGTSVHLGPSFYFSSVHWQDRRVVVVDRHHRHHPHFYDGRSIARYNGATSWHHNPVHRRNVDYHNERTRALNRTPQHAGGLRNHEQNNPRFDSRNSPNIVPNRARDERQNHRDTISNPRTQRPANVYSVNRAANRTNSGEARGGDRTTSSVERRAEFNTTENTQDNSRVHDSPRQGSFRQNTQTNTPSPRTRTETQPRQQEHRMYGIDRLRGDTERNQSRENRGIARDQPDQNTGEGRQDRGNERRERLQDARMR